MILAHGLVGRRDLPIPEWLFGWAAGVVLVASFVALAVLWQRPRLEHPRSRPLVRVPVVLEVLAGLVGVALFALVVHAGLAGTQAPTANLAPTAVYVLFWVGGPLVSLLLGDIFRALSPWRAVARAASWIAGRLGRGALPEPLAYPERLGYWPAAAGILAFTWVELVLAGGDDPSLLAVLALVYAAVQLVGMSLFGIEPWTRHADPFAVYFRLVSTLAPLQWRDRRLWRRRPLAGAAAIDAGPGLAALLAVLIGTTGFDGLAEGPTWSSIAPEVQAVFADLGLDLETALEAAFTVGLVAMVALVAGLYRLGVVGMRATRSGHRAGALARRFAHSLVPIALAYVLAHYFSLLAYQGQAVAYLASDPLGDGSDLFGTADRAIDYAVVSATAIWYVQVGALVVGHVAGLLLAHDRALVEFRSSSAATRSQYCMLAVMIAFTSLGLWLLSAGNA